MRRILILSLWNKENKVTASNVDLFHQKVEVVKWVLRCPEKTAVLFSIVTWAAAIKSYQHGCRLSDLKGYVNWSLWFSDVWIIQMFSNEFSPCNAFANSAPTQLLECISVSMCTCCKCSGLWQGHVFEKHMQLFYLCFVFGFVLFVFLVKLPFSPHNSFFHPSGSFYGDVKSYRQMAAKH